MVLQEHQVAVQELVVQELAGTNGTSGSSGTSGTSGSSVLAVLRELGTSGTGMVQAVLQELVLQVQVELRVQVQELQVVHKWY
jgi:hypothetical protein